MKKENLGFELIQSRFNGLGEIWVEVECEDDYMVEVSTKIKFDLKRSFDSKWEIERNKDIMKLVRKYVSMGKAMVTIIGVGAENYPYDKRDIYRITNRFFEEVECRPFKNDCYEVLYTEKVDTPLKSTNAVMKAVDMVINHVKEEAQKEV